MNYDGGYNDACVLCRHYYMDGDMFICHNPNSIHNGFKRKRRDVCGEFESMKCGEKYGLEINED